MNISNFEALHVMAQTKKTARIATAGPAKPEVLQLLKRVQEEGFAELTFIGDTSWIFQMANRTGLNMSKVEIIHEPVLELPAAQVSMEQVKKGRAQLLMNGYVSSNHMLKAAMDPKKGIRTGEVFSQLTAIELPSFPKLLFVTDTGIQVRAGAREKRSSLANSLGYLKNLGAEEIRVALLRGIPMTEFNGTKDYTQRILAEEMALLENMKEDYPGLILLGPTSLEESMKGEVPDLFLAPNVEAGQVLSHALCAFAGGKAGHIILGGQVPLVLTDDNQTEENLWRSILMALACM